MKNERKREVDDADGAMTGAMTGAARSLTPTSSDEEFVPAERPEEIPDD